MSDETRMILEKLGQIDENVQEMKTDISGLKRDVEELKCDVAELKHDVAELKHDVTELKADVSVLKMEMKEVKSRLVKLEIEQKETRLLVENEIGRKIKVIGEGHSFVMNALDELRGFQKDKEMMDIRILDLEIEMKKVKKYLMIA